MGSLIELNDTLQLTREQGFPEELDLDNHLKTPFKTEAFADRVFDFRDKPGVRVYKIPPVHNFLVENRNGKWIYWGLVHVLETTCDYVKNTTSGKFKIIYIYTPDKMKKAHCTIDRDPKTDFFKDQMVEIFSELSCPWEKPETRFTIPRIIAPRVALSIFYIPPDAIDTQDLQIIDRILDDQLRFQMPFWREFAVELGNILNAGPEEDGTIT